MNASLAMPPRSKPSVAKAWSRALELTAPIARQPNRILSTIVEERADAQGDAPALVSDRESLTYRQLVERSRQYARWARAHGVTRGQVIALLMPNRPEYMAAWLGISRIGGIVALLNTNLTGRALAHCINVAAPAHVIVSADLLDNLRSALQDVEGSPAIWIDGAEAAEGSRLQIEDCDAPPLTDDVTPVTVDDIALYIYTSGTTGLPKAAKVSHARIMQWSHWFAALTDARADDRMYNCLPMYHSVGGVLATGAVLVAGGSVAIRERFSARQFWDDVVRWDCTMFQYIGELCRYLLHAPATPNERAHRIRIGCGNGLRPDVWEPFQTRFAIPQVLEFYASTEGNVSLFNVEGRPGAVGRVPAFLAHRFPAAVVKFDVEREQPVRDERGFCIRCAANEPGEVLGKLLTDGSNVGGRFEGYTSADASEKKILRNVFEEGDAWFRTGDLMRKDDQGFFYFVDRIGDTFRWKGENVATSEVAQAICEFPGVQHSVAYGVTIPGADGRAGMAAIVADESLDLSALRRHLAGRLPAYARPRLLRVCGALDVTGTFKTTARALAAEGFNPTTIQDPVYVDDGETFIRLDTPVFAAIQSGELRF